MSVLARGFQNILTYLCLSLLLLSCSAHGVASMDLDNDDDFDDADDRFSGEVAPARRLYGNGLPVQRNRDTSSDRPGSAFCRLLSLEILDLSNNQFNGELPDCWWEMRSVEFMDLSHNSFSGKIPEAPSTQQSCILESLHLAGNDFTGEFPTVVGGCRQLRTLDIGANGFHGYIPLWIGRDVPNLKILSLKSNRFTGEIPSELSQLSQLQLLDLSNNNLTGLIPREFGKLTSMKNPEIISSMGSLGGSTYYLDRVDITWKGKEAIFQKILELMTGVDLSGNSLSQCIPEELTNLQGLRFLNLSRNNITCGIPKNIGSLKYLESLDLSWNQLSGPIPLGMSSLQYLTTLNLSNNHLSGKIPTGNQLQTLIDPSIYSNNKELCGPPLNIPCTDESLVFDGEWKDPWLYNCVIAGIVFGFWLWCGMLFSIEKLRRSVFFFADCKYYQIMQKVQPTNQFLSKKTVIHFCSCVF